MAIVVTEPIRPFRISYVNMAWEDLCHFSKEEVLGQTLSVIQGEQTDRRELDRLTKEVLQGHQCEARLVNYTKLGQAFLNHLRMKPVRANNGHISHYVGILENISEHNEEVRDSYEECLNDLKETVEILEQPKKV